VGAVGKHLLGQGVRHMESREDCLHEASECDRLCQTRETPKLLAPCWPWLRSNGESWRKRQRNGKSVPGHWCRKRKYRGCWRLSGLPICGVPARIVATTERSIRVTTIARCARRPAHRESVLSSCREFARLGAIHIAALRASWPVACITRLQSACDALPSSLVGSYRRHHSNVKQTGSCLCPACCTRPQTYSA